MSAFPEYGGKRIVFLGAERRENAMRRFAFGWEVPSLRGDRGMLAYTGQNIMATQFTPAVILERRAEPR